jgi:hypothetical protein
MLRKLSAWLLLAACHVGVPAAEPTVPYTVTAGDTLIGLSERVLVTPEAWQEIATLNRLSNANLLIPGQVLQVPLRLLRWTYADARLVGFTGDVRIDGRAAALAEPLSEGQRIETDAQASAVLELADRSRIKLAPSSLAQVVASRRHAGTTSGDSESAAAGSSGSTSTGPNTGLFSGALRLLRGSVEVFATKVLRAQPLEVTTPTAVVGVRGTQYRVGFEEAANRSTRTEVLDGLVNVGAVAAAGSGADVAAGFGAAVGDGAAAPAVVKLLPAPDLSATPERFERPIVRFTVAGEPQALRVQVAADAQFDQIVRTQRVEAGSEIRVVGLDDGAWFLRARRVDALGIEGLDAVRPFALKARPEPPAPTQPRRGAKQTVGAVAFAWAQNIEASSHRLQIASDADFKTLVLDRNALADTTARLDLPTEGTYFWRLASIRANGDQGPFGDPSSFELRPTPVAPQGGLAADGSSITFSWSGRPQDRQLVELARDPAFTDIVASAELATTEWTLPVPDRAGDYFFRYRSVEPDGFVSPYSATLKTVVPKDWSFLWLLFPLLFGL